MIAPDRTRLTAGSLFLDPLSQAEPDVSTPGSTNPCSFNVLQVFSILRRERLRNPPPKGLAQAPIEPRRGSATVPSANV